jgi:methionine-rich copper-binding protein CopC
LVLAGNAADYTITIDPTKLLTLITNTVSKDVQTLNAVEYVQFKDTLKSVLSTVKGDTTAPTLSAKSPAGNATGGTLGTNLTLTFSEAVQAGTGNIVLKKAGVVERTISVGDANQVIFAGSTVVVNPDADLSASANYTLEMGSGVVVDLSGNAYAGLSGYGFATATTATQGAQFVSLANAKLVKDAANNKSTVSFSINMSAGVLDGTKVNGVLFDLDYDHTKVSAARVSGVQYDSSGESTPVWQFLTPNLSGSTANGKIVGLTTTDASNPVVTYDEFNYPFKSTIWKHCTGLMQLAFWTLPVYSATKRPRMPATEYDPMTKSSNTVNITGLCAVMKCSNIKQ